MRALLVAGVMALFVTPAFAMVPSCDGPTEFGDGLKDYGFGLMTETEAAEAFERELNHEGVKAHQTRFWSNCIQTWVTEDGREKMLFFDPYSLRQIPVD